MLAIRAVDNLRKDLKSEVALAEIAGNLNVIMMDYKSALKTWKTIWKNADMMQ